MNLLRTLRGMAVTVVSSAAAVLLLLSTTVSAEPIDAEHIDVRKIWDQAPHNAFTDLIRHDGQWYCVFREGATHVSADGKLRVITSPDGEKWTSAALIAMPDADLRDAKITPTPDGRLMLCGAGALHQPAAAKHQTFVWYSRDGRQWSDAIAIGEPNYWIWRITWHDGKAYGIGYGTGEVQDTKLYVSDDGQNFEVLVPQLAADNYPNESSIVFRENGTAVCLLRRDGQNDATALLGTSKPPYRDWSWKSLGVRVGGPHLIQLPDERIIAAGRKHTGGVATQLWWLDAAAGTLEDIVTLPSGGDTSYPGLALHDGLLWVSYYSSHEGKTSIYLAKVPYMIEK